MKTNHILLLAALTLLASCKKDSASDGASHTVAVEEARDTTAPEPEIIIRTYELKQLVDPFTAEKKLVELQLKSASPEEANKLYDSFFESNKKLLSKMMAKEQNILDNFYSYFYGEKGPVSPPDSIQRKVVQLKNAGLEFCEQGEGYVDICLGHDFYYNMFKKYVTDDYKEYLRIKADEDKVFYSADAGLHVTFKEVSDRVLNWENFIAKYPKSKFISEAKEDYRIYLDDYFFGQDNTPAHDDSGKYYEENVTEYHRYIAKNPNSFAAKLARIALEHTGSVDELIKIIRTEHQKYIGK
ncbi:hypothetical protein AMR72_04880 [Flavobacterium psychrophilum]|nr:hypothetical protein AMR72_04880 [Flavobacterium psychrophilum]AOE51909.1 hypothetical protein ALW18_04875 [Flavobacterium psychrophilum]